MRPIGIQCIEKQLERLIALGSVLRPHSKKNCAALAKGNVDERGSIFEIRFAE